MKDRNILDVFFREKPFAILSAIKNSNGKSWPLEIARKAGCTYSYAYKLLSFLEEKGVIIFNRMDKKHIVTLTNKGSQIAEHINKIKEILVYNGRKR